MRLLKTENRKIDADYLKVSDSYQRAVVPQRVKRITKGLDPNAFGSLTVGHRRDDTYWVVDGFQRLTAARALGITSVPCDVFESEGEEHEAKIFRLKNRERTGVSACELFHAQITERDEQTLEIVEAVKSAGFDFRFDKGGERWPYIKAVRAIERSFKLVGAEGLAVALGIIAEVWHGDIKALQGDMIEGMCRFIHTRPGFDRKRLVDKLASKSVAGIIRSADATYQLAKGRDSSAYGRSMATCDALDRVYAKGARKQNREAVSIG